MAIKNFFFCCCSLKPIKFYLSRSKRRTKHKKIATLTDFTQKKKKLGKKKVIEPKKNANTKKTF